MARGQVTVLLGLFVSSSLMMSCSGGSQSSSSPPDADTSSPGDNAAVIHPGATEMTVRYHSSTNQWIAVHPVGLDSTAFYAMSSSMTSDWGSSETLYSYPEMQSSNPHYTPNVFCDAAKEHVELESAGPLFFTYACNSTVASDVTNNMNLYRPVVVAESLPTP
jgi:hypothetical protein